ncbi:phosphoribosyl-AMP cyclohydrolase [Candidatus Microgenomates bacterium]|nr:phosphoribosyl-AMP cyclohydrolase [Candidatus Microgenomates bacterium]
MTSKLDFNKGNGLIPAIIQDDKSGEILMLGYMNEEALQKTKEEGWVYFWSRSRNKLWQKGEESGNKFKVKKIFQDCDNDTLLIRVALIGQNACHTGNKTCFFEKIN